VKKNLSLAVVSEDLALLANLKRVVLEALDFVHISYFDSEISLLAELPEKEVDVIFSDQRNNSASWGYFLKNYIAIVMICSMCFMLKTLAPGK
jgi:hypothetical protein